MRLMTISVYHPRLDPPPQVSAELASHLPLHCPFDFVQSDFGFGIPVEN
jgi:hypothetical protein